MTPDDPCSGASFLEGLRARARADHRRIVFPEGTEARVHHAVAAGLAEGLFEPVLIGDPGTVRSGLAAVGVDDPGRVEVLDPSDAGGIRRTEEVLTAARRARGSSVAGVDALARDPLAQAAVLVRTGDADGGVAGCVRTTSDVVRAALLGVGLSVASDTLSSAFFMVFEAGERPARADRGHAERGSVLTFTDAGVVPTPTARQLAGIGAAAATAHQAVVGEEPRVAFLSYSTKGSAEGASVTLVREALELFQALLPNVVADGELQGDAALSPGVAARKAPDSPVGGRANVLVFPDLASANIGYKLVQHLGGAQALGPILQGLARPFNDLSRGASASDIVAVACITALMAGSRTAGAMTSAGDG
jgi:phosphate acetyltransferase